MFLLIHNYIMNVIRKELLSVIPSPSFIPSLSITGIIVIKDSYMLSVEPKAVEWMILGSHSERR